MGSIDLYFDRKDLKAAHRAQLEYILRQNIPKISMEAAAEFPSIFRSTPYQFQFCAIEDIDKPEKGSAFNAFQEGTSFAHLLCSHTTNIIAQGSTDLILVKNHTDVVRCMIAKFLPSSFGK